MAAFISASEAGRNGRSSSELSTGDEIRAFESTLLGVGFLGVTFEGVTFGFCVEVNLAFFLGGLASSSDCSSSEVGSSSSSAGDAFLYEVN